MCYVSKWKDLATASFSLVPPLVSTVQAVPSTNTYMSSSSALEDKVVSNDAVDNVAEKDVPSSPYLCELSWYFLISALFSPCLVALLGFFFNLLLICFVQCTSVVDGMFLDWLCVVYKSCQFFLEVFAPRSISAGHYGVLMYHNQPVTSVPWWVSDMKALAVGMLPWPLMTPSHQISKCTENNG